MLSEVQASVDVQVAAADFPRSAGTARTPAPAAPPSTAETTSSSTSTVTSGPAVAGSETFVYNTTPNGLQGPDVTPLADAGTLLTVLEPLAKVRGYSGVSKAISIMGTLNETIINPSVAGGPTLVPPGPTPTVSVVPVTQGPPSGITALGGRW
jgi:hypothetical protein